ncbi:MAG: YdiU family protein [Verrucomicrobiales bacterium]|nr:YdiU family protein [Verrucomicrobiales bacterium]
MAASDSLPNLASNAGWRLEHSYAALPAPFYSRVQPTPVRNPQRVVFNRSLAQTLGLDAEVLDRPESASLFAGNTLPPDALPIAQAYSGHQFGHFTRLGDGRAILLGEQITPDGRRFDIQLKGPGPTPYSRRGDGRAALGPMLREYVISEAMHALGIPTTRSLAVAATGEPVYRESALPGAVLTRVAASHIRVGTFEWAAAQENPQLLRTLADYTLARHYPELAGTQEPYLGLLRAMQDRQIALVTQWLMVGFIHGVMNTDNMALSGETIDYGPCAFMEAYDPATVFSSIDEHGRYAYGNQPAIAQWNLARLAEALLPLLHTEQESAIEKANAVLSEFPRGFQAQWLGGMRSKLGLPDEDDEDLELIRDLLEWMRANSADFTNTFRNLSRGHPNELSTTADPQFQAWHERWQRRLQRRSSSAEAARERMNRVNPTVIPRNHKVEEALAAATDDGDLRPFEFLLAVVQKPFEEPSAGQEYLEPAPQGSPRYRTFCGT